VVSKRGIVATSQVLPSQAGADILARGGSAVDAAIAANAVLSVMEPMMAGPGGDLFAIYRDAKTGEVSGLNASGWAPSGLTIDFLRQKGISEMPRRGIYSVTVPGCVDGWEKLHRKFGRLPWKDLFGPAIYLAANGFPVSERLAYFWSLGITASCKDPVCRAALLPNDRAPKEGDIFRNPDLAKALRILSEQGAAAFYKGSIAAAILRTSDRLGGTFTKADLEQFASEWVTPASATYRGWKVYELPPNSRGIAVLEMLNLLGTFPKEQLIAMGAADIHRRIEVMRLAYADIGYIADPLVQITPVSGLLSPEYARSRAALIDPEHTHCDVKPGRLAMEPGETTYLSVVDREGNIVSLIESLSSVSGVLVDGMGFLLQNRGLYFSVPLVNSDQLDKLELVAL
jgi:gamma-glutamyltranspeptidase/glutathione hydrolase